MTFFILIFEFASTLLGILAICILTWVNQDASHSKRVLVLLLLVVTATNLNGILYHSGWYLSFPQFHKVLYPFTLLIAPFSYIYIRSVFLHEFRFRKHDWLVLLPALFLLITLIPYYLMPLAEKKTYLLQYYQDSSFRVQSSNGILPSHFFPFVRFGWSLLFIVLNFSLIITFTKKANQTLLADNVVTVRWIKILNFTLTLLLGTTLLSATGAVVFKNDFHLPDIAMGTLGFIICLALFVRPKILYGVYMPSLFSQLLVEDKSPHVLDKPNQIESIFIESEKYTGLGSKANLSPSDAIYYKVMLDNFFINQQPFLKSNYTLDHLVAELNVPRYILSAFINREYNMGFREFLNRYRIEYMLANLSKPEWRQYTLEAIGKECGFSSRTTFINNFKEITGQTPSVYLKKQNEQTKSEVA